jgi:predicted P-loop ATPase/GTPase
VWDKVTVAIAVAERRVYVLNGEFFEQVFKNPEFTASPFDAVSEEMYEVYLKESVIMDFSKFGWFRPIQRRFKDSSC